jgi:ankyrin repeat protein
MQQTLYTACLVCTVCLALACSSSTTDTAYTGDTGADLDSAIRAGDVQTVRRMIEENPAVLEMRDAQGWTLLHYAVLSDQAAMVDLLVEKGMDPNVQDHFGMTPLALLEDTGYRADAGRAAIRRHGGSS